jgi:hypothetical protein
MIKRLFSSSNKSIEVSLRNNGIFSLKINLDEQDKIFYMNNNLNFKQLKQMLYYDSPNKGKINNNYCI